jgi:hypothetical protein
MSEILDPFKISQHQLAEACKIKGYGDEIYNNENGRWFYKNLQRI